MTNPNLPHRAREVLNFWFGAPGSSEFGTDRQVWFIQSDAFDALIKGQFLTDYERAANGDYDHWGESAEGALALIILLDQFPRNLFRDDPRAFATDDKALTFAQKIVNRREDVTLNIQQRFFVYLPFEHAEDLAAQNQCLELTAAMPQGKTENSPYYWAKQHHEVINRFGRFPHRNAVLGRESTAEEEAYLSDPNQGFYWEGRKI